MGVVISRGDISNIENIASALIDCEVIFHTQFQDSGDLASMISHNVGGTTNLINAAKLAHCRRFVFLSTAEVTVGVVPNSIAVDETTTIKPELVQSNYGKSMAMAEEVLEKIGSSESVETVIIRAPWTWGKGDPNMKKLMECVKSGYFTWVNDGAYLYSSCYITNLIEGLLLGATNAKSREIYFVADAYPLRFKVFVARILSTHNIDCSQITSKTTWFGTAVSWLQSTLNIEGSLNTPSGMLNYSELSVLMSRSILVSDNKARSKLGYKSMVSFEKGLEEVREEFLTQLKSPR